MSFKNRVVLLSSNGFAMGMVICQIISAAISTISLSDGALHLCTVEFVEYMGGNQITAFVIQTIVCGLYGSIAVGGSSVYYLETWSILKATVTHFLMTVISYYVTGFFLRWFSISDISWCLLWLVIFILTYTGIWLSSYLSYRADIRKINMELNALKMS